MRMFGINKPVLKPNIKMEKVGIEKMYINDMVKDKDYSVESYTVFADDGTDYPTLGLAFENGITEDKIVSIEDDMVMCDYILRVKNDNPDLEIAKMCGFGVIKILNGNFAGQKYLFPQADTINVSVQLGAYCVLKYDVATPNFCRNIRDKRNADSFKWILGIHVYEKVMDKLFEGRD